jgi:hypothetical protein
MNRSGPDKALLVSYLLGRLAEHEREAVAERLFADESFAEEMEGVECDLLDGYARGELSTTDRAAVAARYCDSAMQRQKLEFAFALAAVRRSDRGRLRARMIRVAAVAAIVLIWWVGWMRRGVERPMAPGIPIAAAPPVVHSSFAVLLSPGGTRGSGLQPVSLPKTADTVQFHLELTGSAATRSAALMTAGRQVIWSNPALSREMEAGTPVLIFEVPAVKLTPGRYRFEVTPGGVYEFVIRPG